MGYARAIFGEVVICMSYEDRGRGGYGDKPKTNKVYVTNLSYLTTEEDLKTLFGEYGRISEVSLKRKETITFAFIEFESIEEASAAIDALNRKTVNGLDLKCEFARGERKTFNNRGSFGDRGGSFRGRGGFDAPRRDFGDRPRGCFNCGQEGHMIRDCPKPKKPREDDGGGYRSRGGYDRGSGGDRGYSDRRGGERERKEYRRSRSNSDKSRSRSNDRKPKQRRRRDSSSKSR